MAAVVELGEQLLADDDWLERVVALGLDEHNFLRGSYPSPTSWVTAFVVLDAGGSSTSSRRTAAARATLNRRTTCGLARRRRHGGDRSVPGLHVTHAPTQVRVVLGLGQVSGFPRCLEDS
jgi:hypothetical protein